MRTGHDHGAEAGPQPSVYTLQTDVGLGRWHGPDEIRRVLTAFVTGFVAALEAGGCRLIGHVKGALETASGGCLYFNVTSFAGEVATRGALGGGGDACRLTLNAIVFGIDQADVERAAVQALEEHVTGALC